MLDGEGAALQRIVASRAKAVVSEPMDGVSSPRVGVSDLYGAQQGHGWH